MAGREVGCCFWGAIFGNLREELAVLVIELGNQRERLAVLIVEKGVEGREIIGGGGIK